MHDHDRPEHDPGPGAGPVHEPAEQLDHRIDGLSEALESTLLPPDVDELAASTGLRALRVPAELVDEELPGKSTARRVIETVLSFAVVVAIFAFAIPAVTNTTYAEVWDALGALEPWHVVALFALWIAVMWTYTGVLTSSLPGLGHTQALVMNFAGSAVANVVPFGGAVGVGATYAMGRSWGFGIPSVTRSILVSGVWNVFAKLGIPVSALVLLQFSGQATKGFALAALAGLVLLGAAGVVFALVLRSERLALAVGGAVERVTAAVLRVFRRPAVASITTKVIEFRHDSVGLIRARWRGLTFWMVAYTLGQYLLLLGCVRALGATTDELGWVEVYAAFAFNRLLSTIPLTPSGVGFAEAGGAAALIAFGADNVAATSAILLFSTFTYLLEIPLGLAGWGAWAWVKRWRRPVPARTTATT